MTKTPSPSPTTPPSSPELAVNAPPPRLFPRWAVRPRTPEPTPVEEIDELDWSDAASAAPSGRTAILRLVADVTTTAFSVQGPAGTYSERSAWGSLTSMGMSELSEELGEGLAELEEMDEALGEGLAELKEVNGLSEECGEGLAELGEQEGELDERERVEGGRWGTRRGTWCHWQAKRRDGAGGLRVCREQQLGEDYGTYRAPSLPKYPSSLGELGE